MFPIPNHSNTETENCQEVMTTRPTLSDTTETHESTITALPPFDEHCIDDRRSRDEAILECLQHAAPMMRNIAYRYKEDYDDLYQMAAEVVCQYYRRAQQTENPAGYLQRAIRNTLLRYVGVIDPKAGRKQTLADHYQILSLDALISTDSNQSRYDITADTASPTEGKTRPFSRLYDALSALPAIYRQAVSMRYGFCGYGVHRPCEIARILGIAEDTERSRFRSAKALLRKRTELLDLVDA
jgi:RNA polymerase sigma factor (sigma-70 family)